MDPQGNPCSNRRLSATKEDPVQVHDVAAIQAQLVIGESGLMGKPKNG